MSSRPDESLEERPRNRLSKTVLARRWSDRRYLVPNGVTVGSMFCGFLAILYSASGRYEKAALAIAISILLDGLDGRVARKLNATSKFGVEFDSFSDLISFGVAPAMLLYHWCFETQKLGDEFGVLVTFVYAVCAASRLARFNITDSTTKGFTGLPTPGAAGVIAALVNYAPVIVPNYLYLSLVTVLLLLLGYLMVSNIPFLSIKHINVGSMKLKARLAMAVGIALIWYNSAIGFLVLASAYAVSGPLMAILPKKQMIAVDHQLSH